MHPCVPLRHPCIHAPARTHTHAPHRRGAGGASGVEHALLPASSERTRIYPLRQPGLARRASASLLPRQDSVSERRVCCPLPPAGVWRPYVRRGRFGLSHHWLKRAAVVERETHSGLVSRGMRRALRLHASSRHCGARWCTNTLLCWDATHDASYVIGLNNAPR